MITVPRVQTDKIPRIERTLLCSTVLREVEKFYKNPANVKAFERWKREQLDIRRIMR